MKLLVVFWALAAMAAAAFLASGIGPHWMAPDWVHVVGHFLVFGGLALIVDRVARWKPATTLLVVLVVGVAVELAQVAASGTLLLREIAFDVMVDALAVMTGLALGWRSDVARAIGFWLHPAVVVPVGLVGTFYAALRDLPPALLWTSIAIACWLPAVGVWLVGVTRGWFSDWDLVDRKERPRLFLLACGSAALFVVVAALVRAPAGVLVVALGIALTAVLVYLATNWGLKISGHVTVALLLAVAIAPWSYRGPLLFIVAAALLSWGRLRSGCHRPAEVAAAWGLAALLMLPRVLVG